MSYFIHFIFLETVKVLWTCYWCFYRRPSAVINFSLRGNLIGLALLLNIKNQREKPLWPNKHSRFVLLLLIFPGFVMFLFSHSQAALDVSFCVKQAWYRTPQCPAQMCHVPSGHAGRVGSMYNDPQQERHVVGGNEKNGLCILRGFCWNVRCCLREGFRWIVEEGCTIRELKMGERKREAVSGLFWSHLSVWQKYESAVWYGAMSTIWKVSQPKIQPGTRDRPVNSPSGSIKKAWD